MFIPNKQSSKKDIESFIYKWNLNYPIDRWWREKHKVIFNSPQHRVVSFLDMYIEWLEDKIYKSELEKGVKNYTYKPGDWLEDGEKGEEVDVQSEIKNFEENMSKFD